MRGWGRQTTTTLFLMVLEHCVDIQDLYASAYRLVLQATTFRLKGVACETTVLVVMFSQTSTNYSISNNLLLLNSDTRVGSI